MKYILIWILSIVSMNVAAQEEFKNPQRNLTGYQLEGGYGFLEGQRINSTLTSNGWKGIQKNCISANLSINKFYFDRIIGSFTGGVLNANNGDAYYNVDYNELGIGVNIGYSMLPFIHSASIVGLVPYAGYKVGLGIINFRSASGATISQLFQPNRVSGTFYTHHLHQLNCGIEVPLKFGKQKKQYSLCGLKIEFNYIVSGEDIRLIDLPPVRKCCISVSVFLLVVYDRYKA